MWISPFSSHTAPFLLEGTHSTMLAGLGWLPTTAASCIWSHQVPSFVQFWSYVWAHSDSLLSIGHHHLPLHLTPSWSSPGFWVSLIISYLVWYQLLVPGDSYLAFISVTWQVEGWERALGAPSPWHTEYCLCSFQHPLKQRVPVNFSHLREGSCIQQAARF